MCCLQLITSAWLLFDVHFEVPVRLVVVPRRTSKGTGATTWRLLLQAVQRQIHAVKQIVQGCLGDLTVVYICGTSGVKAIKQANRFTSHER